MGKRRRACMLLVLSLTAGQAVLSAVFAAQATNLWSLHPLQRAAPPAMTGSDWPRNPVDQFVLAALAQKGLSPSPEADRQTLIRRLSYDVCGLPPTPAEVQAFVNDPAPDAYERLVDRLLSASQYGERWGRHWLDVARYTESQGFEYDHMRENAWPYRDYVIASFNDDKPYDQFMREQIAGDLLEPFSSSGVVATSFLVCGAWDQAGSSQANAAQRMTTREEELEDMISVVGQSFLGLTINCARCHAHKFDPIPQADYYRIKSVFEGVRHGERPLASPDEVRRHEETLAALKAKGVTNGLPRLPAAYAGVRKQPEPTHRLKRGDVRSPAEVVRPGALSALTGLESDFGLEPDAPEAQRRLRFADWLADRRNPLPARVIVNRLWQYHFGQGIVATPNDFGASGAQPTHPALLDWLANQLIDHGWRLKTIHRLVLCSSTFRQTSTFRPDAAALDADNQRLWRFSPHRLEAEALRDAMLVVSGQLNLAAGGPSFRPFDTKSFNATFYYPKDKPGPEFARRTVYRMNVNSGKDPMLEAFDCPDPSVKTPRRGITTTPLQALALMNGSFVQRQAAKLAERVSAEAGAAPRKTIALAYRYCLGRWPSTQEIERAEETAREAGLETVCWALLNSTEFLYVR